MPRKKSRKPRKSSRKPRSMDAEILQKLKEIDREFKSMERFRLSMAKSRKKRIMSRIKKGAPADYKGYKKELTARVKTHLTRVNKSIKAYSKILKKKSRKPRKKSRKPRKKSMKKSKRKKMRMCACGVNHFHMKKAARPKKKSRPRNERMDKFLRQIIDALKICSIQDKKIYHDNKHTLLSQVIAGQDFAKHKIFSRISNNRTPFELIEAAPGGRTREAAIKYFYEPWLCTYATHVKEQARIHKEKKDDEFLGSHEFGKLSVDKNTSDLTGALANLKL